MVSGNQYEHASLFFFTLAMNQYLIWANWKLNMHTKEEIQNYMQVLNQYLKEEVDVAVFPQLAHIQTLWWSEWVLLWAQNVASEFKWAFTGEVSIETLLDLWVNMVMIGHSERRQYYNETDETVAKKVKLSLERGIRPLVCIWESLEQKQHNQTLEVLERQLHWLKEICDFDKIDIAYEPVWAIGTGLVASRDDIETIHGRIRAYVGNNVTRILYGGSSNDTNAADLIAIPHVNGFLVWWAALDPHKFGKMIGSIKN
jgi:triosephosphate isomerase